MIRFEEAHRIVIESARLLEPEPIDLKDSLGRILAEDVYSDIDMPPFDKSAMDGYACRREDLTNPLEVLETVAAGQKPEKNIERNQCSKIMTGAPVPQGADCVIMVEHTRLDEAGRVLFVAEETNINICFQGEDVRRGQPVLKRFLRIQPQQVAILATVGKVRFLVSRRPRVGIIATGDELVEPAHTPPPFSIRNSNSYQLYAQTLAAGSLPSYYGIAKDSEESIDGRLRQALEENDVVLLSGGVSMGDFDLTPAIMARNGLDIKFDAIAIKPGKPTHFGLTDRSYCFGLPGNPVSSFLQFELLVKPFLCRLMGHQHKIVSSRAVLKENIQVRPSDRESWMPVSLVGAGEALPLKYHGSAHIHAMDRADGFIVIPIGSRGFARGTTVDVRHL